MHKDLSVCASRALSIFLTICVWNESDGDDDNDDYIQF